MPIKLKWKYYTFKSNLNSRGTSLLDDVLVLLIYIPYKKSNRQWRRRRRRRLEKIVNELKMYIKDVNVQINLILLIQSESSD